MFRSIKQIETEVANLPFITDVERCKTPNYHFRLATTVEMPNGERLDIFLSGIEGVQMLSDGEIFYEYFSQIGDDFLNYWSQETADLVQNLTGVLYTASGMQLAFKENKYLGKNLIRFLQAFDLIKNCVFEKTPSEPEA